MLFQETVSVYCGDHTEHTDTVRTSRETRYVSVTEQNRLMLFGETVAVYCEKHTEHRDAVRTSQETHYVSATEPNRLILFGETVAAYCENHTEHTDSLCGENAMPVNVPVSGKDSYHRALMG
jgi:thioredoxin-related protein